MDKSAEEDRTGLCGDCAHARRIVTARSSVFFLCELSASNASFPKYPRLPVFSCSGYRQRRAEPADLIVVAEYDEAAKAYGDLKRSLAMRFRDDREAYNAAKREFVESVLRAAEASR